MRRNVSLFGYGWLFAALVGCSPALNWRDVRFEQGPLLALFPCKPDQGTRVVPLGERQVPMTMLGCEADGVLFTLARVDAPDPALATALAAHWRVATLASAAAQVSTEVPFILKKSAPNVPSVWVSATGQGPDGSPLSVQVVWVGVGSGLYQAAVYEPPGRASVAPVYFEGLRVE